MTAPALMLILDAVTHLEVVTYGESDYIADNYGRCARETCECLKPRHPWLGRGCPSWVPVTAKTFKELSASYG